MIKLILLLAFVSTSPAFAQSNCAKDLKRARADFKKLYDQKKYKDAAAKLSSALDHCGHDEDDKDLVCWAHSDLGLGLLKSGDAQACRDHLASHVIPNVTCDCCGASEDDGKSASAAEKAAYHNYELCNQALAKDLEKYKAPKCALKLPARTLSSVELKSKECLALVGTEYGKDYTVEPDSPLESKIEANQRVVCPKLVRLAKGKTTDIQLGEQDTLLGSSDYCCKFDKIAISEESGGKVEIHVSTTDGPSQPCGGSGTARSTPEGIYELEKNKLTLKRDLSEGIH